MTSDKRSNHTLFAKKKPFNCKWKIGFGKRGGKPVENNMTNCEFMQIESTIDSVSAKFVNSILELIERTQLTSLKKARSIKPSKSELNYLTA